jgi:LPXTG-motif cell wall-anchored protein
MKARNILITVAVILILFNSVSYLAGTAKAPADNSVAYWIGYNFLLIIGLILLIIAFVIHRKVKRKREKEMIDSLFK